MDSRPLLNGSTEVGILIDSNTFEEALDCNSRLALALLNYLGAKNIDFIRTPFNSKYSNFTQISEYTLKIAPNDSNAWHSGSLHYVTDKTEEHRVFHFRLYDIERVAKMILNKESLSDDEISQFIPIFIQATFADFHKPNEVFIFLTENEILLKNRLWFESNLPQGQLNIMTIHEASIFLDLFFKLRGEYRVIGNFFVNKGLWYGLSLISKVPHFDTRHQKLTALGYRLQYALMALDEIGIQYYLGVNNDTQDDTLYHFNYLISLITGIFDSLALITNDCLGINMPNKIMISLSPNSGNIFLKQIAEKKPILRDHIRQNCHFINIVYSFRELIIHREGLRRMSYINPSKKGRWKANFIVISKDQKNEIHLCGDKKSKYDKISNWGIHTAGNFTFLEPYNFSVEVTNRLILFIDKYLELLEIQRTAKDDTQEEDPYLKNLELFEKYHLGF